MIVAATTCCGSSCVPKVKTMMHMSADYVRRPQGHNWVNNRR